MKMKISCHLCHMEMVDRGEPYDYEEIVFEIKSNGAYDLTCPKGHKWTLVTTDHNYQMLFELGCMALLDGYTREAVTSFATSLERFYEYCIEVFVLDDGIDDEKHQNTWKLISKSSERQLGAFYYLFLSRMNELPVKQKEVELWASFRNNVVHKGEIPSEKETYKYARYVFESILNIHHKLKENVKPKTFEIISDKAIKLERQKQGLDEDSPLIMGLHRQTAFPRNLTQDNYFNTERFEDVLEGIEILKNTLMRK